VFGLLKVLLRNALNVRALASLIILKLEEASAGLDRKAQASRPMNEAQLAPSSVVLGGQCLNELLNAFCRAPNPTAS
jgi:hypothetical protein